MLDIDPAVTANVHAIRQQMQLSHDHRASVLNGTSPDPAQQGGINMSDAKTVRSAIIDGKPARSAITNWADDVKRAKELGFPSVHKYLVWLSENSGN